MPTSGGSPYGTATPGISSAHGAPGTATGYAPPSSAHGSPGSAPAQSGAENSGGQQSTAGWLGSLFGVGGAAQGTASGQAAAPGTSGAMTPGAAHGDGTTAAPEGYGPAGLPGSDASGAPGAVAQQFEPGTAEHAIQQVALKMAAGDQTGLEEFISDKAKGELAKFRAGEAEAADIADAKQAMVGVQPVSMRDASGGKSIVLRNQAGQLITFTAKREGGAYKVTGYKVEMPRGRR